MPRIQPSVSAIDLFCGAGGLTRGLLDAGINVVVGYDIDHACQFPYEHNNLGAKFCRKSITTLKGSELARFYPNGHTRVLVGCAPCQTFSKYTQGLDNEEDPKWTLLKDFARLVKELNPDIVSMENVPELKNHEIFYEFLAALKDEGFHYENDPKKWVIYCPDYGIPQQRERLVIVASRFGPISLVPPTHKPKAYKSVAKALQDLPALAAGKSCATDPLHRTSRLSNLNLRRIQASTPGGSWRDWPSELQAKCHKKKKGKSYPAVYGRMEWDKPAPTISAAAQSPGPKARIFLKYDTNKNGVIDGDEIAAVRKAFAADPKGEFVAYDVNGDGKLNDEEIAGIKPPGAKKDGEKKSGGKKKADSEKKTDAEKKSEPEKKPDAK